jgi:hypothetical protein
MRPTPVPRATHRTGRNDLYIIAIIACLVVSAGIAIGFRLDYILREMTTLSVMAGEALVRVKAEGLAQEGSYDLRNNLFGTTVLGFSIREHDRADGPAIRSIIREEFDKVRPYLGRVDIRIIFEPDRPAGDAP